MSKRLIKEVKAHCSLFIDDNTGIAWIENGSTGLTHSVHPNIDKTGSVTGMKRLGYWKKEDKILLSNGYHYNISKFVVGDDLDNVIADYCQCEGCKIRRGEING